MVVTEQTIIILYDKNTLETALTHKG